MSDLFEGGRAPAGPGPKIHLGDWQKWPCVDPETGATFHHHRRDYLQDEGGTTRRGKDFRWDKGAKAKCLVYVAQRSDVGPVVIVDPKGDRHHADRDRAADPRETRTRLHGRGYRRAARTLPCQRRRGRDGSGLVAGTAPCRTRQPVRVVRSRSDSIRRSGSARGGGQADNSGNVSDGGPVDAAVAVDAQTRPQRLGQAADGLPTATTGTRLIVVFNRGWGNFR